ncbi:MAG: sulfurtransferase complex subunit TusB [Methylococcaceae bacterium]|nr:sulfurtransferase complex subunit TusB [Methylococcaceae bacterium]
MGILHLVNRSPHESQTLIQCLERAGEGDSILLLESGVYAALKDGVFAPKLAEAMRHLPVYVLREDLEARGIAIEEICAEVSVTDYEGFVDLSVMFSPIQSWF